MRSNRSSERPKPYLEIPEQKQIRRQGKFHDASKHRSSPLLELFVDFNYTARIRCEVLLKSDDLAER